MKLASRDRHFVIAALIVACSGAAFAACAADGHQMISAKELKWSDVPSLPPGAKVAVIEGPMSEAVAFTVRLKLPANYRIPPHTHPAVERFTVLQGTFFMGLGEKADPAKAVPHGFGDMSIMVPNTAHFGYTKEETLLQIHGTGPWGINYIDPADDPRKKQP
ncbi:MAG TPA: cupin domain-containing protein [Methylibium sp.]|nr:cupin domain-containing protein [Methylibium sp.]